MISTDSALAENAERASRRRDMAAELRQALAEHKLHVVYQPIVELGSEAVILGAMDRGAGVETLVRWNHRILGAVSPMEFIGVAEECGLVHELCDFVLSTACGQFVLWQETLGFNAPQRLAVNLSRAELMQDGFVASVRDILDSTAMPADQLQFEVRESLVMQDAAAQSRLRELKTLGLTLALDNFGVGYSSLVRLHQLPVDVINIDRSFFNEAVASVHHRVLIDAIVRVANSLHMNTVAEGIETEVQLAIARHAGCREGQGFFFSEAMSAANLEQWLTAD